MADEDTLKVKREILDKVASLVRPDGDAILFSANGSINGEPCGLVLTASRIVVMAMGLFGGDRVVKFRFASGPEIHALGESALNLKSGGVDVLITDLDCNAHELCARAIRLLKEFQSNHSDQASQ